jgi:ribonuclease/clavin/mitogillin
MPEPITVVNVGYRSTNYWVVSAGGSRVLVDLGWPGTMGRMRANLRRMGVPLEEIRYGLATHYHIDHAGLGQDLKEAGVTLLTLESQEAAIGLMKQYTKPWDHYNEITSEGNLMIPFGRSRTLLEEMGIGGEILSTPGHSDDSVSLLLDDGSVFTGDLPAPGFLGDDEAADVVRRSWALLGTRGARRVYPGHGPVRPMDP